MEVGSGTLRDVGTQIRRGRVRHRMKERSAVRRRVTAEDLRSTDHVHPVEAVTSETDIVKEKTYHVVDIAATVKTQQSKAGT